MIPLISFYIIIFVLLFLEIKIKGKILKILILEINHISYNDLSDAFLKYVLLIKYLNDHMTKF